MTSRSSDLRGSLAASSDPRVERTRSAIVSAAEALIAEGHAAPAVAEIVRRSGVSRASFYSHFASSRDVVVGVVAASFAAIRMRYEEARALRADAAKSQRDAHRELAQFATSHADMLRTLSAVGGIDLHDEIAHLMADEILASHERFPVIPHTLDARAAARYVAHGSTGLILDWVRGVVVLSESELTDQLYALIPEWLARPADPPSTA